MPLKRLREFFRLESAGGILLMAAALLAVLIRNSPWADVYKDFFGTPMALQLGDVFVINKPLLLWINDGLMAVFFLLVGLEIKREVLEGQLSSRQQVLLPAVAAMGGVMLPALIYILINAQDPVALRGWAIPAATDIAFALGVISLLGKRVPESLKVCLVAIAIMDDLAAIVIIALFYTESLSLQALQAAAFCTCVLLLLKTRGITRLSPYIVTGVVLWACVLKSGIHATLAGVILALFIPLGRPGSPHASPLRLLEHSLHPWVAYGVLPLFAFANAGLPLAGVTFSTLLHPVTLGIAVGLFCGKQVGVAAASALAVSCRICRLPDGVSWPQFYGMAILTGVGFTMSLFIGGLAFSHADIQTATRLGVLTGSLLSAITGYALLRVHAHDRPHTPDERPTTEPGGMRGKIDIAPPR